MNIKLLYQTLIIMVLLSVSTKINAEKGRGTYAIPDLNTEQLKILDWNIYMLPHCNIINKNKRRARAIADKLETMQYDIIVFQEAFDYRARRVIRRMLKSKYPYMYGPANETFLSFRTNSGLWILSKIPLTKLKEIEYKSRYGIDALARKGAVLFQGNWCGHEFQIAATHLQADSPHEIRRQQCREIASELLEKYAVDNIPQFVCGDFNIEMDDTENYSYMLNSLKAENGALEGEICVSYDEIDNRLAKREMGKKRLIDYILIRNQAKKIASVSRRISVLKEQINRKMDDLSDHYGIEAHISFRQ
jgi:endonuclease/exonuclease/phosphatase family metal-dependent hydrolase